MYLKEARDEAHLGFIANAVRVIVATVAFGIREFTKGGLVKGGLAIYVLLLYYYC